MVENFLECYHCATAHPGFSAEVDVHPDRYLLEAHATYSAQYCAAKATGDRGQFHLLYPNTGINVFPGPPNLSIGPVLPNGTGRTERYLDYFFAPGRRRGVAGRVLRLRRPGRQGGHRARRVGAPRHGAGLLEQGRLLLRSEPLLAAFQGWVAERVSAD